MRFLCIFLLAVSISACSASNENKATDADSKSSADPNAEILKELKEIHAILQRMEQRDAQVQQKQQPPPAPRNARVSSKGRPALGDKNAPLTLVEFSDYQCPFCKRFYNQTLSKIKTEYIDQGKLRLVYKDLPLPFHKQAYGAAVAAHCAGAQGKYWEMHDMLFENNPKLQEPDIQGYADELALDATGFSDCIKTDRFATQIDSDIAQARAVGISGTPSFVLGKTSDDMVDGVMIRGALPFEKFKAEIDTQLGMLKK